MIYKIVGSLILVVGTAALGVYYAGQYMERLRNLIELKKALMQMQGETSVSAFGDAGFDGNQLETERREC